MEYPFSNPFRKLTAAIAVGGLALIATPIPGAAAKVMSTSPRDLDEPVHLRVEDGKVFVTLDEALEIALRRNLNLQIERYTREQFRLGIEQAMGIFDLRSDAFVQYAESTSPTVNPFIQGAAVLTSERQIANFGLSQLTPIGGDLSLSYDNTRSKSNSSQAVINPAFNIVTSLQYNLPLLRNFGRLATRRDILVARVQDEVNQAFFEQQAVAVVQQVENAYWDLLEARKQLEVAEESLDLAKELDRRNRIQVEVGTRPPLDLVQSEATVATRQEEIIRARTRVGNAADQLAYLLNLQRGTWDAEIVPETPAEMDPVEIDLEAAVASALAERPEMAQQRGELDRLGIESRYFRNQKRPGLDLTVAYGLQGLGGDLLVEDPEDPGQTTVLEGGYGDAFDQVKNLDFDQWLVSLTFAYPIQNRAARAASVSADLELERGQTELQLLEQQIITEVRTAARELAAAEETIESASVSRRLQERNVDAEAKRYENGMSTTFQVTEIQEQLAQAQSREVTAVVGYRRALVEYQRVLGTLLEVNGIEIENDQE